MDIYRNSTHVIDNFFNDIQPIIDLGNSLEYHNNEAWPGLRTDNLLQINNTLAVEFAKFFAKNIADKVFYGLSKFEIDVRFHKNDLYDVDEANSGWIHNDDIDFAGLVYLNKEEPNMSTGTSIFDKTLFEDFEAEDYQSRKELNLKKNVINKEIMSKYNNSGFALVYDPVLKKEKKISKKIDNKSLFIFHKNLKKNSFVKITNPINQKTVIAEVISNKVRFSDFYNSVITSRIADELSLNLNEPYIDLVLISQNSTFIAKKAKTYNEEKKVAEKAPVDGIQIDNLGDVNQLKNEAKKDNIFSYSIKIADFYYKDSAMNMSNRIIDETNIANPVIKTISNTKYRVLLGPFNDIKKLEDSFNEIKSLDFENIEILKDV